MAEFQREGQRMKCTLTHYRKKEHTHEEFIRWIVEKHLPLAITILKKHGVLGYSLVSALCYDFELLTILISPSSSSLRLLSMTQ